MAMESSYSQQMFEERRSAKIGREEDIEDIKQEALMVSRKRAKKANKPKTKQSKLLF
jgi:protein SPT2